MKDLFGQEIKAQTSEPFSKHRPNPAVAPLAEKMRPHSLEDFVGQEALIGKDSPLRHAIEQDRIHSFIMWGPPGTGKTTLAEIIARTTNRNFIKLSAVLSGVKDIKDSVAEAKQCLIDLGQRTILFIDEIHRFNKAQQDALLPFVEDGTVTLIGATTENPSFELNSALLSRAPVYVLQPISDKDLNLIIDRSLQKLQMELPESWKQEIIRLANSDARRALTLLQRVLDELKSQPIQVADFDTKKGKALLQKAIGARSLRYDASGEEHYNTISAFIKSMRDSDPDAALYYLARMLEAGEDPLFISRRMVIFASEDIGNADPRALQVALCVKDAVDFVGLPEARINLGHGVTYLSCAPKSNASYMGIEAAIADVKKHGNLEIPLHIRNAPTKLMKGLGYGQDYKYAHNYEDAVTDSTNLPSKLIDTRYYAPKDSGLEKQIRERLEYLKSRRGLK